MVCWKLWITAALIIADAAICYYLYRDSYLLATALNVIILITIAAILQKQTTECLDDRKDLSEYKILTEVLFNNVPCAAGVISTDFTVLMVNNALTNLLGMEKEELVGKRCFDICGGGRICPNCPVPKAVVTKKVQHNTRQEHKAKGGKVIFGQTAVPVVDKNGKVKYILEIGNNITDRVALEQANNVMFLETVTSLAKLIESRDEYTGTHSAKVRDIAVAIGRKMKLNTATIGEIAVSAILHDIGKIGIPEPILNKPGHLTSAEYEIIKQHPEIGYDTLVNIAPLSKVATYVLHHHERYDGKGYPGQKCGNDIPLVSRILSVADVYEAVTADRVYRRAMNVGQAINIINDGRGTQFDPEVVDALFALLTEQGIDVEGILACSEQVV